MKYLLAFLITLNVSAMSLEKIEGLTVEKSLRQLIHRLDKQCSRIDKESAFVYLNLECEDGKPTEAELSTELAQYKSELIVEENSRIAEKARTKDIRSRLKALKHRNVSMSKILKVVNPAAWLRDNISKLDHADMEIKLLAIEAQDAVQESEAQVQSSKEDLIKLAKERIKVADCETLSSQILKDMCIIFQR